MGNAKTLQSRRAWLALGIICNLAVLLVFKYFNFFSESIADFAALLGYSAQPWTHRLLLPVGISFYTFQTISYLADVYAGRTAAEKHLGIFALYVSFFPQLVAGPIERSTHLLPQFTHKHTFNPAMATDGLRLILWGLFLKVVLADNAATYVNAVYSDVGTFGGLQLLTATVLFSVQIVCDFGGYSAIAIGSANLMGFDIMENFRRPYLAVSVREFWSRWHISLSTWFRDYVYIPLGGNRAGAGRHVRNVLITFGISGLWHGAAWTFVLWGLLHGIAVAVEHVWHRTLKERDIHIPSAISIVLTFMFVNIGWVLFRSSSVSEAWYVLTHMASNWHSALLAGTGMTLPVFGITTALIALTGIGALLIERAGGYVLSLQHLPRWGRWTLYLAQCIAIMFLQPIGNEAFIYFQF